MKKKSNPCWTEQEDVALLSMHASGMNYCQIAERLGRTHSATRTRGLVLARRGGTVTDVYPRQTPSELTAPAEVREYYRRPRQRGDCLAGGCNEERPCPWATCRYHLSEGREVADGPSCALDAIDTYGTLTLEEIGDLFNLTRERIRQIADKAMSKIARKCRFSQRKLDILSERYEDPRQDLELPEAT